MNTLFNKILTNYREAEGTGGDIGNLIRHELPETLISKSNLDTNKYQVTGSCGVGTKAFVPWLAIFDKGNTTTAQKGFYIVYLFKCDMSGVYISLNQGITYFDKKYTGKIINQKVKSIAYYLQSNLNTISPGLDLDSIDLASKSKRPKGYEAGHITGKYYSLDNIPNNNILVNDLRQLLVTYNEILGIIKNRTNEEFIEYILTNNDNDLYLTDEDLSDKLNCINDDDIDSNTTDDIESIDTPEQKKEPVKNTSGKEKYPRNIKTSIAALKAANFQCEYDNSHFDFIRRSLNQPYVEPHHLIPIQYHQQFNYSLDVKANIVSLCSRCHNCLHYGSNEEKEPILKDLYDKRIERLNNANLHITFEELMNFYI